MWLSLLQGFFHHQMMCLVVIKAVLAAIGGRSVG